MTLQKTKIGITGCTGRMGRRLVQEILSGEHGTDVVLAGGTVKADTEPPEEDFFTTTDPSALFAKADVMIDFTSPEATKTHARLAAEYKTPLVMGTTGLNKEQENALKEAAQNVPVLYAANTSLGVTLLLSLVRQAAQRLGPEWDIEIAETHHRHKVDAPSGTALALGQAAHEGRDGGDFVTDRTGSRGQGTIGFSVQRGGDVVGEHDVTFFGAGERLTLSHAATDRALFARGAIRAALWVVNQPPGLYRMEDVLGV